MADSYLKKILKFLSRPFLGKKVFQPVFKGLFWVAIKGMNFGGGSTWSESGEEWVVESFAHLSANTAEVTFFDVGANRGEYALAVAGIFKKRGIKAKIFSFEPSKKTFELLTQKTSSVPEISRYNLALGEKQGTAALFADKVGSGLASLYNRDLKSLGVEMSRQEDVRLETLENFCRANNISRIDFLKLDVEGNEYKVLLGAGAMLKNKSIRYIQFEFGGADIDAKVFFKDFFNLLSSDYDLFRILQNGLQPLEKYRETDEIFITTNYLAVLK